MEHEFKPYTDFPDMCVAELSNGDTCNRSRSDHPAEAFADLQETAVRTLSALQDKAAEVARLHDAWVANEDDDDDEDMRYAFIDAAIELADIITGTTIESRNPERYGREAR